MKNDSRLVLDTNTVMALWLFRDPGLAPLAAHCESPGCVLLGRADALEELRRVLAYRQFAVPVETQAAILNDYAARLAGGGDEAGADDATAAPPALPACRDPDDQKFLEIARDRAATHLVTRDKALLRLARHRLVRERFRILTPERFVAELADALAPDARP
ncbi:MAG: PIN domain-containing protein [Thauera phenolivorans]|uniref:PIN domain-containing protein n=1 Tax=Thauera phenolivorans TaxID=1792543 RepID=A0A7X7LYP1_9RHOO|nr:PIN domain-containing protein [Thauera phenolivorans]NLF55326.1 PIN domain-containing protein [Thauera phenolivorans]